MQTFLLGIDGLPRWMWRDFAASGVMPYSAELLETGRLVPMQSSTPEVSSAAWSSIVTGENPGGHNVFGFTDLIDGSYAMAFTSSRTLKAKPFWQTDAGPHLVINVPQSYPALPLDGVLASGFVALDLAKAVYPSDRLPLFEELGYRVDVDMTLAGESKKRFISDLHAVLDTRLDTLERLLPTEDWSSAMFVVTGTDRLNHFLWEDYEDTDSPHHQAFLDFYHKVDRTIQRIVEQLDDETTLVVVSDHGFARQDRSINVNSLLAEHGYLSLAPSERPSFKDLTSDTQAFALDPGRIHIHRAGRYPNGQVAEEDVPALEESLIQTFLNIEIDGRKVVDTVRRGRDVYEGPWADRAPDLILMPAEDTALSGRLKLDELIEPTIINGKHTFEESTFFYRGAATVDIPETMKVENVLDVIRQASARRAAA